MSRFLSALRFTHCARLLLDIPTEKAGCSNKGEQGIGTVKVVRDSNRISNVLALALTERSDNQIVTSRL